MVNIVTESPDEGSLSKVYVFMCLCMLYVNPLPLEYVYVSRKTTVSVFSS